MKIEKAKFLLSFTSFGKGKAIKIRRNEGTQGKCSELWELIFLS